MLKSTTHDYVLDTKNVSFQPAFFDLAKDALNWSDVTQSLLGGIVVSFLILITEENLSLSKELEVTVFSYHYPITITKAYTSYRCLSN